MTTNPVLPINLASDPFRRERAQTATYFAAASALLCSLLVITGMILHSRSQASRIRQDISAETAHLQALQNEQGKYSVVLARPRNADIFSQSVFLNELIARRAVSWTRVFADLQTVLPSNIRIESIRLPQVPAQAIGGVNQVQLDMTLGSDRPDSILRLLKNLEGSSVFGTATVVSQVPPTQNDPLYKYRVNVSYAQKL